MNPEKKKRLIQLLKEGEVTSKEFEDLYAEYLEEQKALKKHFEKDDIIRRQ